MDTTLSLNELENSSELSIYPNPTKGMLNINSNTVITEVEIYNYLGQRVLFTKNLTIDISALSPNPYILKIYSYQKIKSIKFIKY